MKKIALTFSFLGLILCVFGAFLFYNEKKTTTEEPFDPLVHTSVSEEDKKVILDYLKLKYNDDFEVIEHTTDYCSFKNDDSIDYTCEKKEIFNSIYKVKDKKGVPFYVKKVNDSDKKATNKTREYHNDTMYDNYVTFNVIDKIEDSYNPLFENLGDIEDITLYHGIGVDYPEYKMENGKYKYYVMYSNLHMDSQNLVNKDMSIDDYLFHIESIGVSPIIKLHTKINKDINSSNFQDIIKMIKDDDFVNMDYGLETETILFEFSNNLYIKYDNGLSFELYRYKNSIIDGESFLAYDKKITLDFTDVSDDTIYYDDFINLEEVNLIE